MIWETVLENAHASNPIVIISADKRAFSDKDPVYISTELISDLTSKDLPADCVRRIQRVSEFTSTLPRIAEVELEVETALSAGSSQREVFENAVIEEMLDWDEDQPSSLQLDLRLEVDSVWIDVVHDVGDPTLSRIQELDDGKLALSLEVEMDAALSVLVWKADAAGYDGREVRFTDFGYNESFAEGSVDRTLLLEVEARFDLPTSSLEWVMPYNVLSIHESSSAG